MQEEVTGKSVALIINGAKMSEQVLEKALQKFLEAQKNKSPKMHWGKQTLNQLSGQNAGLANIEISDKNIKAFTHVVKKYHVDFALKKDTTAEQPRYLVFFKSRDVDAITAAFQEFASRKMGRDEKPSVRERLAQAREQAAQGQCFLCWPSCSRHFCWQCTSGTGCLLRKWWATLSEPSFCGPV